MQPKKKVCKVNAKHLDTNTLFQGYEIHIGETFGLDCERPFALIDMKKDGAISENGLVIGTYLHGMFVNVQMMACRQDPGALRKSASGRGHV